MFIKMKPLFLLLMLLNYELYSDEKLGGQEIIEKLDTALTIREGLTQATLSLKKGSHETHFWKVHIFKQQDDVLYTFEITNRKPVAKFLSTKRGSSLLYYNVLSGKYFQIEQMERMDQLLHTSFSYLDLSNYQYEANYKVIEVNRPKSDKPEPTSVTIEPVFFPSYKQLQVYVDNTNYAPIKIDFTSSSGLLTKTMKFKYGTLKVRDGNSISDQPALIRLELTDNATNFTSILEFKEWDKSVQPDKIQYEMRTLYEK